MSYSDLPKSIFDITITEHVAADDEDEEKPRMESVVEEEPQSIEGDSSAPEIDLNATKNAKAEETAANLHLPAGVEK